MSKVKNSLRKEAIGRGMTTNIIKSIEDLNEIHGIDGLQEREKFENIIFRMSNSLVIKQKRNGKAAYQHSATMSETDVRTQYNDGKLASSDLKFYRRENGSVKSMGVYLPAIYKGILEVSDSKITDKRLLNIIGFRIPTSGIQMIESIIVKGFLPETEGDIVVLPSEIVVKAGSDYDIDKLNLFFPNAYKAGGDFHYIEDGGYSKYVNSKTKDFLASSFLKEVKKIEPKLVGDFIKDINKVLKDDSLTEEDLSEDIQKTFNDLFNYVASVSQAQNILPGEETNVSKSFDAFLNVIKNFDITAMTMMDEAKFNQMAIENRMNEVYKDIITHPENFDNVIRPLDNPMLKDLANDVYELITGKKRTGKARLSDMGNRLFLNGVAQRFMQGKSMVGPTALISKYQQLAQANNLYIGEFYEDYDTSDKSDIKEIDKIRKFSTRINLKHNTTNIDGKERIALGGIHNANYQRGETDYLSEEQIKLSKLSEEEQIPYVLQLWVNAAVDAAKDPFTFDMNVSMNNLNIVLYLVMAGTPMADIVYFMNQPIIREYVKSQNKYETIHAEVTKQKKYKDAILYDTLQKFGLKNLPKEKQNTHNILNYDHNTGNKKISLKDLKTNISTFSKKNSDKFNEDQRNLLADYIRYQDVAKKLTKAVSGATFDTNGAGKNIGELAMMLRSKYLVENDKVNGEAVMGNYSELFKGNNFVAPYYREVASLTSKYKPLIKLLGDKQFTDALDFMIIKYQDSYISLPKAKLETIVKKLIDEYISYQLIKNPFVRSDNNKTFTIDQNLDYLFTTTKEHDSIARQLSNLKRDPEFKDSYLIQQLQPILKDKFYNKEHIALSNSNFDTQEKNRFIAEWQTLLNNPKTKTFALDLALVTIAQNGISHTPVTFTNLIPAELYTDIYDQTNVSGSIGKNSSLNTHQNKSFIQAFFLNNFQNPDLVVKPTEKNKRLFNFTKEKKLLPEVKLQYDAIANSPGNEYANRKKADKWLKTQREKGRKVYEDLPTLTLGTSEITLPKEFVINNTTGRRFSLYSTYPGKNNTFGIKEEVSTEFMRNLGARSPYKDDSNEIDNSNIKEEKNTSEDTSSPFKEEIPKDNSVDELINAKKDEDRAKSVDKYLNTGVIVNYKGKSYFVRGINSSNKVQLTDLNTGENFPGTPDKYNKDITINKALNRVEFNNQSYYVDGDKVYSKNGLTKFKSGDVKEKNKDTKGESKTIESISKKTKEISVEEMLNPKFQNKEISEQEIFEEDYGDVSHMIDQNDYEGYDDLASSFVGKNINELNEVKQKHGGTPEQNKTAEDILDNCF